LQTGALFKQLKAKKSKKALKNTINFKNLFKMANFLTKTLATKAPHSLEINKPCSQINLIFFK